MRPRDNKKDEKRCKMNQNNLRDTQWPETQNFKNRKCHQNTK